jgi:hypothetical protein
MANPLLWRTNPPLPDSAEYNSSWPTTARLVHRCAGDDRNIPFATRHDSLLCENVSNHWSPRSSIGCVGSLRARANDQALKETTRSGSAAFADKTRLTQEALARAANHLTLVVLFRDRARCGCETARQVRPNVVRDDTAASGTHGKFSSLRVLPARIRISESIMRLRRLV